MPQETSVYKILRPGEFQRLEQDGVFAGGDDDRRDGFIHLSTSEQVRGTLDRHFCGESDLVILEFASAPLGTDLKWEASRGGALFPHLYGKLLLDQVKRQLPVAHFLMDSSESAD